MARQFVCRALVLCTASLAAATAAATDRHFTYTYETGVLNPGAVELEPWTTSRFGRTNYYHRFDQRLEFEVGLAPGLQTSIYWNFSSTSANVLRPDGTLGRSNSTEFSSVSSEWKYKLTDPVANGLGSALYFEFTVGPKIAELEAKLLFDKHYRSWIFAGNLIGAREWEFEGPGETERETELAVTLAAGYAVTPRIFVGAEAWQLNELQGSELETSVLFAGPVAAYAADGWWSALSVMPQLASFAERTPGSRLDLTHQERLQTRLLFGIHL